MITAIVLSMLGVALAAVLVAMVRDPGNGPRAQPTPAAAPRADPLDTNAWDARPRDVISISGASEDLSDLDFPVDGRAAYEATHHRWVELSGQFRGHSVCLEVYRYPRAEYLGFLDARRPSLMDLRLTEDRLAEMDAAQDPKASIEFEGARWRYESSREIAYYANESGASEGLYRWLFGEEKGDRLLCIEKREGEPFEIRLARRVDQRDITVYRA